MDESWRISRDSAIRQRDEVQARLGRAVEALQMLWDHYLLVITDEQKAQVRAVVAEQEKEQP